MIRTENEGNPPGISRAGLPSSAHILVAVIAVVLLFYPQHDGAVRLLSLLHHLITGAVPRELVFVVLQLLLYAADGDLVGHVLFELEVYRLKQAGGFDTFHGYLTS